MARKKKDDQSPTKAHNLTEMKQVIRDVAGQVITLKAQKGEIQAQITEARSRVKAFGIKMADFNAALRLYELEGDERRDSIINMQIAFEALSIGQQGDLFPAQDGEEKSNGKDDPRPGFLKDKHEASEPAGAVA